jgi:hypothetical protein
MAKLHFKGDRKKVPNLDCLQSLEKVTRVRTEKEPPVSKDNICSVLACLAIKDLNRYLKILVRIGRTPAADKRSKLLSVSLQGGIEFEVKIDGLPGGNSFGVASELDARRTDEFGSYLDRFYSGVTNVNRIDARNLSPGQAKNAAAPHG